MSLSVMLQQLASGMVVSVEIFVVTLIFSLPLGLLICFGRMAKNPVIRGIVSAYISVMRGTPLMLQLMVVYFGPYFIFGIRISMGYSLIAWRKQRPHDPAHEPSEDNRHRTHYLQHHRLQCVCLPWPADQLLDSLPDRGSDRDTAEHADLRRAADV